MTALADLTEEEAALFAILSQPAGTEFAEFEFEDLKSTWGRYRIRDYQWELYLDESPFQASRGARSVGKSAGIQARAAVHPFASPGSDMLITAPQLNHLRPVTQHIEERIKQSWLARQMYPSNSKSDGFIRQPQWEAHAVNSAKIISRLPGQGPEYTGIKGQHAKYIELDECQDYPDEAAVQLRECLNPEAGAIMRVHGVPTGVRNFFYSVTEGSSGTGQGRWRVHQPMAMMRETWDAVEREDKTNYYHGRKSQGYVCNIYGQHGDSAMALFVLARLIKCVDLDRTSDYNQDVYRRADLVFDQLDGVTAPDALQFNGMHKSTWAGASHGYSGFYGGMDVGITIDPSEILIFGQRKGMEREQLDLLLRVHLEKIPINDQQRVVEKIFEWYGERLITFGIDSTAVGFGTGQALAEKYPGRVKPYNFGAKAVIGIMDRELEEGETEEDLHIIRNVIDFASDTLREIVDAKGFLLPNEDDLISDWQGQTVSITKRGTTDPYGRRSYSGGKSHTLDAAKTMIAAKRLAPLDAMLAHSTPRESILDLFMGDHQ